MLVVGIEEYELVGVEKQRVVEAVPALLLEVAEIVGQYMDVVRFLFFLSALQTVPLDIRQTHYYLLIINRISCDQTPF